MQSVLIAEDDRSAREGLNEMLATSGFSVDTAQDGVEALEKLKKRPFDVMLLDVWMPRMNGLQLLTELRTHPTRPKVVVMTADDTPETVLLTLRAQAYQFLRKPISVDALRNLLRGTEAASPDTPSIVVLSARPGWVELLVPCARDVADRVPGFIRHLETDLPQDVRETTGLVFRELLLDVMDRHGHLDSNRKVRVAYLRAKRMLLYRIADAGYGFRVGDFAAAEAANAQRAPAPADGPDLRLRPGILLARAEADEFLINEDMNELVFVKYLD
jgi:CheY-like chemotaxis protein